MEFLNLLKMKRLLKNFYFTSTYMTNEETEYITVFKHNFLNLECFYNFKNKSTRGIFFIFKKDDIDSARELKSLFKFVRKDIKIDQKLFFSFFESKHFDKSANIYVRSKSKKNNSSFVIEELEDDYIRIGVIVENLKIKKSYNKEKGLYDSDWLINSLEHTLLYTPQTLNLNFEDYNYILKSKPTYSIFFNNKDSNNVSYDFKKFVLKDYGVLLKNNKYDLIFEGKYIDLETLKYSFNFNKEKRGLSTFAISELNNMPFEVDWNTLYDKFYNGEPSETITENVHLLNHKDFYLGCDLYKVYTMKSSVYEDKNRIYFEIELKEDLKKNNYNI